MPFRFFKRIALGPGLRLNLGKSGASFSFGFKGFRLTLGKSGLRQTVGIPGTGIYHTSVTQIGHEPAPEVPRPSFKKSVYPKQAEASADPDTTEAPEHLVERGSKEKRVEKFTFQNLCFGETPDEVKAKLEKYVFRHETESGALVFSGKVANKDANIYALFTATSRVLYRVGVVFPVSINPVYILLKAEYKDFVTVLSEKYGRPKKVIEYFMSPFREGDGHELTAIQVGKAALTTCWEAETGSLTCMVMQDGDVSVTYEDADLELQNAVERRKLAKNDL